MDGILTNLEPAQVLAEFDIWFNANWSVEQSLADWRDQLARGGWIRPAWPRAWYGRDLPAWSTQLILTELARREAVGPPTGVAMDMVAPTLLNHGSDELRTRHLLPILSGREVWCQLFSEPGAGSDLAGLSTSAACANEGWVINGQKVWTTGAHVSDFGLLLARTDLDAPKHEGITCFALPMTSPGVEVRPLRQMNGYASFNEVFLTDVVVEQGAVVGAVNHGWEIARTALMNERRFGTVRHDTWTDGSGRIFDEARDEADAQAAPFVWYPQRGGRPEWLVSLAREFGVLDDRLVRHELVKVLSLYAASQWTAERLADSACESDLHALAGTIGKLAMSKATRAAAHAHTTVAGLSALDMGGEEGGPQSLVSEILLSYHSQSIAGGTDEIQRDLLAERALGLPREPRVDRGVAFRSIKRH